MYVNNPQIRRAHEKAGISGKAGAAEERAEGSAEHQGGGSHPHSVHIHHAGSGAPHPSNPHHVHIHHADGRHEHSDHASFQEAMSHAGEASAPLGEQAGAPADGAEMEDGY